MPVTPTPRKPRISHSLKSRASGTAGVNGLRTGPTEVPIPEPSLTLPHIATANGDLLINEQSSSQGDGLSGVGGSFEVEIESASAGFTGDRTICRPPAQFGSCSGAEVELDTDEMLPLLLRSRVDRTDTGVGVVKCRVGIKTERRQ